VQDNHEQGMKGLSALAVRGPSGELTTAMAAEYAASFRFKPLDPRLYPEEQCLAGELPDDHPAWYEGTDEPVDTGDVRLLTGSGPKAERPDSESMSQAQTWDKTRALYSRDGLCDACASQAAWGHQIGFKRIKPPCADCAQIAETFPVAKSACWRGFPRGSQRPVDPAAGPAGREMNGTPDFPPAPARVRFLDALKFEHEAALGRGGMVAHHPDCCCSPCAQSRPDEYYQRAEPEAVNA